MKELDAHVDRLYRARRTSRFARVLAIATAVLIAIAWFGGSIEFAGLFEERRAVNLRRFFTHDIVPPTVRNGDQTVWQWTAERIIGRNGAAVRATVALATVAAVLAALQGALLATWTSRTGLAADRPFEPVQLAGSQPRRFSIRAALGATARALCVLMRAVPEYVLAFLFGAFFRDPAWACVLALAVHNAGILGRLYGETIENLDQAPARAWYLAGSPRLTAMAGAQLPAALPRGLTYFFIRFETCVRESTILGAIGFVSLGHWIVQERAAGHYDEMMLLVALGAAVVIAADFVSWMARRVVRAS